MIFKNRQDAARQLTGLLAADALIVKADNLIVLSLLRGGLILGDVIAHALKCPNLPLVVAKIPAPFNPELAVGALCFDQIYLNEEIINLYGIEKQLITKQIDIAKDKFNKYINNYNLTGNAYFDSINSLTDKTAILVDDGIATGASIIVALKLLKERSTKANILAAPAAPADFINPGFDKIHIIHYGYDFTAVSQYYVSFPPVNDEEVIKILQHADI